MDMADIVTDYQYLNQVQTQSADRTHSAWKAVSDAAKEAQGAETGSQTEVFAEALRRELDNLQQQSELGDALATSSLLGVTEDFSNVSEMLKTESGRKAIGAMADHAMTSIVFGTNNSEQDSVLQSLNQKPSASEQSLEEALKDILEILESKGAGDQTKSE